MRSRCIDKRQITVDDGIRFPIVRGLGQHVSIGIREEASAPKLNFALDAHAIRSSHKESVGDRMTAHHCLPCGILTGTVDLAFAGNPANRSRIEQQLGPLHRGQTSGFGIPLIPANADTDFGVLRLECEEPQIAWGEVEFFVVQRIIRDVHLAVHTGDRTVGIQHNCGIVIQTVCTLFKQRHHDHNMQLLCNLLQRRGCWPGDRLSQLKPRVIFGLAWVLRVEDFLQTDDLSSLSGRFANLHDRATEIVRWRITTNHLHQTDAYC